MKMLIENKNGELVPVTLLDKNRIERIIEGVVDSTIYKDFEHDIRVGEEQTYNTHEHALCMDTLYVDCRNGKVFRDAQYIPGVFLECIVPLFRDDSLRLNYDCLKRLYDEKRRVARLPGKPTGRSRHSGYRYQIQAQASNIVVLYANTLLGIQRQLDKLHPAGNCSIIEQKTGEEIYHGTVQQCFNEVVLDRRWNGR